MQAIYPERFERDMSCTAREWLELLPRAIGEHQWRAQEGSLLAWIGTGSLVIEWREGEARAIGSVRLPRLHAVFRFDGVDGDARHAFMKRFDLYTQRGGG